MKFRQTVDGTMTGGQQTVKPPVAQSCFPSAGTMQKETANGR
jgi:hypothetical protein